MNLRSSDYEPNEMTMLLHTATSGACLSKLSTTVSKPFPVCVAATFDYAHDSGGRHCPAQHSSRTCYRERQEAGVLNTGKANRMIGGCQAGAVRCSRTKRQTWNASRSTFATGTRGCAEPRMQHLRGNHRIRSRASFTFQSFHLDCSRVDPTAAGCRER